VLVSSEPKSEHWLFCRCFGCVVLLGCTCNHMYHRCCHRCQHWFATATVVWLFAEHISAVRQVAAFIGSCLHASCTASMLQRPGPGQDLAATPVLPRILVKVSANRITCMSLCWCCGLGFRASKSYLRAVVRATRSSLSKNGCTVFRVVAAQPVGHQLGLVALPFCVPINSLDSTVAGLQGGLVLAPMHVC
jgi:hypothetical protein